VETTSPFWRSRDCRYRSVHQVFGDPEEFRRYFGEGFRALQADIHSMQLRSITYTVS
jgi:hypothetical protein